MAELRTAAKVLCNFAGRHIAGDSDVQPEDVYAAILEVRSALATDARPDSIDAAVEGLDYGHQWDEFRRYEARAAKAGSGMTRAQMTGAAMMLGWLCNKDTPPPGLALAAHPAEAEESHATD